MKRNRDHTIDERKKIDKGLVLSINKVVASKKDTTEILKHFKHFKHAIANNMPSIEMIDELYKKFPSYRHIDDLAKYFLLEKKGFSDFKLKREMRELNMYHAIKEIIRHFEGKGKSTELTSTAILDLLLAYTESSESVAEFAYQDNSGISRFNKKIGFISYEGQYITKDILKEKILKLHNDKGNLEGISEKILISAFIRKVLSRNEYTGYNNKVTQATRRKYVLYLLIDYDNCKNEKDMRVINEIVKSLGFKLQMSFSKQLRQVDIGITSLVIVTFTKEAMRKIKDLISNNYVYDVYKIRETESERVLAKKIRIVTANKLNAKTRIEVIEKHIAVLKADIQNLNDDENSLREKIDKLHSQKQRQQQKLEKNEWKIAFYTELQKKYHYHV